MRFPLINRCFIKELMAKIKKVPLSQPQPPLQSPFSALSAEGLPAGPDTPTAPSPPQSAPGRRVVLRREKSGRGGKTVVVVSRLSNHLSPPEIETLCRDIRKSFGCGGISADDEIEIQGDQPARVRAWLESAGFSVAGP